jgi:hypothetical protein
VHHAAILSEIFTLVIIAIAPDVIGIKPNSSKMSFQNKGAGPLTGGNKAQTRHIQPERKKYIPKSLNVIPLPLPHKGGVFV